MATKLRELRGLPEAIQKQFEEQQKKTTGKDDDVPGPLMTMSQWKVLKQADLNCADKCFDVEEKQGLPMLAATMAESSISS